ncbi:hypothetical protein [Orenia marismortui]|uniref:PilX-like prepilin protein n=1 Tax=Orenia marismortui TaxID=46469 RepID=A0A4R8HA23_9FIRM|nr:hypothetical protein [Orenia marismortui]TDX53033.1 hypothetical protein C7959_104163 [Orenia marismortui]
MNIKLSNEEGSLALTMVVMVFVSVLSLAILGMVMSRVKMVEAEKTNKQAYYVARSGVDAMVDWIEQRDFNAISEHFDVTGGRTTNWLPFTKGDGLYKVEVEMDEQDALFITGRGKVGDTVKTVKAKLLPTGTFQGTELDTAVFAMSKVEFRDKVQLHGGFGINKKVEEGDFKVTGKNVKIHGDCYVGPETDEGIKGDFKDYVKSNGDVKELKKERVYSLPSFPNFPTEEDGLNDENELIINSGDEVKITEDGWYDNIVISNDSTVKIELGDNESERIIRVENLTLESGRIIIDKPDDSDATVKLFVDKLIDFVNDGTSINSSGKNDDVTIFYEGNTSLTLSGTQQIVGDIYVKSAPVNLDGTFNILGHLVSGGDQVTIVGDSFDNNSKGEVRTIYAPHASVVLESTAWNNGRDKLTGSIIGKEVVIGSKFDVTLFKINIDQLPFDFKGGRRYKDITWFEGDIR